jgi:hypothetical protein
LSDYRIIIGSGLHNTHAVDEGIMRRVSDHTPDMDLSEMILSGPHIFVSNPFYKNPRKKCELNSDYDIVDSSRISKDYLPRVNYIPKVDIVSYRKLLRGFDDEPSSCYLDYYKMGFREMVGAGSERTLSGAILPKNSYHINKIISLIFKDCRDLVEFCGLASSIVLDFIIKIIGATDITPTRLYTLPLGIDSTYLPHLVVRALMLNCITEQYASLWEELYDSSFNSFSWSLNDRRLLHFSDLEMQWSRKVALKNYFERRLALVEIDVLSAMALGLSLNDLEMIYRIQFPILQQNEEDTWYDAKGSIVFTCSVGLKGVGVDRPKWEEIRNQKEGETYTHTIDPAKSELYGGQQITYYAPYTKCDRIEDYRRAWAHFEKVFKDK